MYQDHLSRLKDAISNQFSLDNLAAWIEKHTYLNGRKYSFKNYEFQRVILNDRSRNSIIVKCAQVGLSELAYRYAVATCCTQDDWTLIYTFPTSTDAQLNNRQRIDPMIEASPELARLIDPSQNNSEVKKFGANSFLMFKGTRSETQALSTPANALVHDEVDKSDPENMSTYVSRLQNKPHKIRKLFSTPTIEKFGISKEAETAKRHKHFVKCEHCNHHYMPDYFTDIHIPGWDRPMEDITARNIHLIRWKEAVLLCPKCKLVQNLHHERMHFICENPSEDHEANAWYITPFSAHKAISLPGVENSVIPYLVEVSTKYKKYSEFKNQSLGITAEDKNEQLVESDFDFVNADLSSSDFHCMGIDVGQTCHITIGKISREGIFVITHRERCILSMVEKRSAELSRLHRVVMTVWDQQPETALVSRICDNRRNNFGAMFSTAKTLTTYAVTDKESDDEEGTEAVHIVKVNRTAMLDALRDDFKAKLILIKSQEDDKLYTDQLTSLKRVQRFTQGELTYIWEKTGDEDDHYHFSTLYLYLATKMRGMAHAVGVSKAAIPIMGTTKAPIYQTSTAVARPIIKTF